MKSRHQKLTCLLLETVGIAALFLPLTGGASPWGELRGFWHFSFGPFWILALPALIAPMVFLQSLRSLSSRPLTQADLWLCAVLVGLLALFPLSLYWWEAVQSNGSTDWDGMILAELLFGSALLVAGLLLTLSRRGVSAQFLAPLALRGAYFPNAVFGLMFFSDLGASWNLLDCGAACVAATMGLYLVEGVFLVRQGLKDRPAADPER